MTQVLTNPVLSQSVTRCTHEAAARLEENPFYARLLDGSATRQEYIGWLVQMHKYVRYTAQSLRGLVAATASATSGTERARLHDYALKEAQEEAGHDELILRDLSNLWGVNTTEALGRIERAPTSPAATCWQAQLDTLLSRFPEGIVGPALALETIATLHADRIRLSLVERTPAMADAVQFLAAHAAAVEAVHGAEGAAQIDRLGGTRARSAAYYFAGAALAMFEGLSWYLHERFSFSAVAEDANA